MPVAEETTGPVVVKVGGSLYDLRDLGPRLRRWLAALDSHPTLLVAGGGAWANVVRELDATHELGEEYSHWLALRTLTVAAHFLAALVPGAEIIGHPRCWDRSRLAVLDAHAFVTAEETGTERLPHSWGVSSDSVAARVARVASA